MNKIKIFSAALPIIAILVFASPIINVVLLPEMPNQSLISGLLLFIFWLLIIIAAFKNYWDSRGDGYAGDQQD